MAYSSIFSTLANPQPTDRLNSPSHSQLHRDENAAILEIERAVGLDSSILGTVIGDLRNPASDGGGHVQTANRGGTGQISYNKGDLLVASSSSVLTKLTVGGDGQVLSANSAAFAGVSWGAGAVPTVRTYATSSVTSSGTSSLIGMWFKPSTLAYAVIEIVGPGGGGGGNTFVAAGSAGGGAGGYGKKTIPATSLPLAASIIAGTGGAGGTGGGGVGGGGGTQRFGSILTATGGFGGDNAGKGGAGGSVLGGDINVNGSFAMNAVTITNMRNGGNGASSPFGAGGIGGVQSSTQPGGTGLGFGSGGGGAYSDGGADTVGGPGADGYIVITEY